MREVFLYLDMRLLIVFVLCFGLIVACVNPVVYPRTILKCTELHPDGSYSSGLEYWDFNKINRSSTKSSCSTGR